MKLKMVVAFAGIWLFASSGTGSAAQPRVVHVTPDGKPINGCDQSVHDPAWFNNPKNWGSDSGQIGPGTTVLICGRFVGDAGKTEFTFQGDGAPGNPVTLLFDDGAALEAPYWAASPNGGCGGAICIYKRKYVTIDGGKNGVIRNTANGTALEFHVNSEAIEALKCDDCTVQNLHIENIYVEQKNDKPVASQGQVRCMTFSGTNWTIRDNVMHDMGWCLVTQSDDGDRNISIHHNTIYNIDHGWALTAHHAGGNSGPFEFHDNKVYGFENWDTVENAYHHDGIHCFTWGTNGSPAHISALNIYNNLFGAPTGTHANAYIFIEGGQGTPCADATSQISILNNVLITDSDVYGLIRISSGSVQVFNNTFIGAATADGYCFSAQQSTVDFRNNALTNSRVLVNLGEMRSFHADNNLYGKSGDLPFVCNKSFLGPGDFARWKACIGNGDAHSKFVGSLKLDGEGHPLPGSPVLKAGANLTSLGITQLNLDTSDGGGRHPVARPTAGPWDAGAFQATVPVQPSK